MNKISIIMPVYNVEEYIRQSIESVLNQTFNQLEIIIVDDGTKDSSAEIAEEYAKKDSRIKLLHKENGGLSSARNYGLDAATGKYIMFLDSDDFLEKNACEILYNAIESQNVDYVIGNYIYTTHEGKKWSRPMFNIKENIELNINDYEKSFFVMNSVVWNKIFRRDFIEKNKLRFIEGALAEDAIFTSSCYPLSPDTYFVKDIILNYRQNKENKSISTNCTKDYFYKLNEAYKLIYNNYKKANCLGFYRFFCARIMPFFLCKIIDTNELKTDDEIIDVLRMTTWYFKQKEEFNVIIMNDGLKEIIDDINNEKYNEVLEKIKNMKKYRNSLNSEEKENMYFVNKETFEELIKTNMNL